MKMSNKAEWESRRCELAKLQCPYFYFPLPLYDCAWLTFHLFSGAVEANPLGSNLVNHDCVAL